MSTRMRIGILGKGNMATALGTGWRAAGHSVRLGDRSSLASAGSFGSVTLLAVPATASLEVLAHVPAGVVIDCTNAIPVGHTYADLVAARPDLQIVKAFNLSHESVWRQPSRVFGGRPLVVPLCGPSTAVALVSQLVTDLGCTPVDAGPHAELLEATAAFAISLWFQGVDAQAILQPLTTDDGTSLMAR